MSMRSGTPQTDAKDRTNVVLPRGDSIWTKEHPQRSIRERKHCLTHNRKHASMRVEQCDDKRICDGGKCSACQTNMRRATKRKK